MTSPIFIQDAPPVSEGAFIHIKQKKPVSDRNSDTGTDFFYGG